MLVMGLSLYEIQKQGHTGLKKLPATTEWLHAVQLLKHQNAEPIMHGDYAVPIIDKHLRRQGAPSRH
jgi:hypothetical protein